MPNIKVKGQLFQKCSGNKLTDTTDCSTFSGKKLHLGLSAAIARRRYSGTDELALKTVRRLACNAVKRVGPTRRDVRSLPAYQDAAPAVAVATDSHRVIHAVSEKHETRNFIVTWQMLADFQTVRFG